jgi:parallel beta-helix repeat protein
VTTIHVAPSGSNGTGDGSSTAPYATISYAITQATPGDIIEVAAGSYNENISITKSLTLKGANYNTACGSRGAESIINGTGVSQSVTVNISADNVTVNGFEITNQSGSFGVLINANNNISIQYNYITNIGNNVSGSWPSFGVYDQLKQNSGANTSNVNISYNCISNVRGGANTALSGAAGKANNGSGNGIGIGDSQAGYDIGGIVIDGNVISNVSASSVAFGDGGKGAYGIIVNVGATTGPGKAINAQITNNSITSLAGLWSHGVGLEGETPEAMVLNNYMDGFTDNKGGTDAVGVKVEDNAGAASVELHENSFTNMPWAIQNATAATVTATCNWYGTTNTATIASKIAGSVTYSPYLTSGTDNSGATGFQPVPNSCFCSSGTVVKNTNTNKYYCSIQSAISDPATVNGHTITASAGNYNEDVTISKSLTIQGAGYSTTTVSGPIGGGGSTFAIAAPGIVLEGFTITRDGNNTTDWNGPLNSAGVSVAGLSNYGEVRNCRFDGNRTGIDINNSNGNNVHNNIISNNRTGVIFRNQADNTNLQENSITNNWTVGVLFLDASVGTNIPVQTALNSTFNNNNISGNWYGDVVDRQTGGALPPPGTTNMKNFECNWYGTTSPTTSTANSAEPGYAAQIPTQYGGTAVPPSGPQPDILGPASANIDYTPWLTNGADAASGTPGFQPAANSCNGNYNTPSITCPADKTIGCGESTDPSNTGYPTAGTNCGSTQVTYSDPPPPACKCNYSFVRTWTAKDACNNQNSCTQTITVSGPVLTCSIDVTPSNNTYTGGDPKNIYLSYGPQSATMTVNPTSGSSFTYSWAGPTGYLDCTNCQSPVFTPTSAGTYTFTVTVTNDYGCTTTCSVTFCVKDVAAPGQNGKVYVCHAANGNTLSVAPSAVPGHLGHGDHLGRCDQTCGSPVTKMIQGSNYVVGDEVKVYPNPNKGAFTITLPFIEDRAVITITDVAGKSVQNRTVRDGDGNRLSFDLGSAARGMYFVEVNYNGQIFRTKLIVQ